MGRHILFKCPRLGTNVQHWLPETPPEDEPNSNAYASVVCLACTRLHFIHKETGKLLLRADAATGRVTAREQGRALCSLLYCSPGTDSAAVRNRIGSCGA